MGVFQCMRMLTSITAYRENNVDGDGDIDYTSVDIARGITYQESEMFTQELRLTSTGDSRLQWWQGLTSTKSILSLVVLPNMAKTCVII